MALRKQRSACTPPRTAVPPRTNARSKSHQRHFTVSCCAPSFRDITQTHWSSPTLQIGPRVPLWLHVDGGGGRLCKILKNSRSRTPTGRRQNTGCNRCDTSSRGGFLVQDHHDPCNDDNRREQRTPLQRVRRHAHTSMFFINRTTASSLHVAKVAKEQQTKQHPQNKQPLTHRLSTRTTTTIKTNKRAGQITLKHRHNTAALTASCTISANMITATNKK